MRLFHRTGWDCEGFSYNAGDKRLNVRKLGQRQPDDDTGYATGFDFDVIRRTEQPPAPDATATTDGDGRFGSSHPGRFNAVFADGSVRSISYSIDPVAFRYLGHKSDGQVISGNEL